MLNIAARQATNRKGTVVVISPISILFLQRPRAEDRFSATRPDEHGLKHALEVLSRHRGNAVCLNLLIWKEQ